MNQSSSYYTVNKPRRITMQRTTFNTVKISFDDPCEFIEAIKGIHNLVNIVSITTDVPDSTTTKPFCLSVYYEHTY